MFLGISSGCYLRVFRSEIISHTITFTIHHYDRRAAPVWRIERLLFHLFPFRDDVTGLSLSLQWANNVHTMQSLRAKRLEEGALLELLQTKRRTYGDRRYSAIECRKGVYKFKDQSSTTAGNDLHLQLIFYIFSVCIFSIYIRIIYMQMRFAHKKWVKKCWIFKSVSKLFALINYLCFIIKRVN